MKNLNMEKAIDRYNSIMWSVGYECSAIEEGHEFDGKPITDWTLRDMVAEADYILSCYYESGNCRCDDRFIDAENYKIWVQETGYLKRFIKAYKPFIEGMTCVCGHCSKYDNNK